MRHNCHIFEPEALRPGIADARRYLPCRQRSAVLVQSVGATGKTTLANLVAAACPIFPYLPSSTSPKPSVVLCTNTSILHGDVTPISGSISFDVQLFGGSHAPFSRSFSDGMFRSASSSAEDATAPTSPRQPVKHLILDHAPSTVPLSLVQPALEEAMKPHLTSSAACADVEIAFAKLSISSSCPAVPAVDTSPLTIVECQAPDDRPAMHLTHSVVFMLAEDDAIFTSRSKDAHATGSDGPLRSTPRKWNDREAALVAHMTAVTTCDGDVCNCCLVVNMGKYLRTEGGQPKKVTEAHSDASNGSRVERGFVEVDSCGNQSPAEPDVDALEAHRKEIARRWRISEGRVFLFSARRMLAERLTNPVGSADSGAGSLHLASNFDRSEFFRFLSFLRNNAERASKEWLRRQDLLAQNQIIRGSPQSEHFEQYGLPAYHAKIPVESFKPSTPEPARAASTSEADFFHERQQRFEEEAKCLASRRGAQESALRSILASTQDEQVAAAQRVVERMRKI